MTHEATAIESILQNFNGKGATAEKAEEKPPEALFPFDSGYQEQVAALCIRSSSFLRRTQGLILPDYFENSNQAVLVNISITHYENYGKKPVGKEWLELIKAARASRMYRDDMHTEIVSTFKRLRAIDLPGEDYAVDLCAEFARHQEVSKALLKSIDLVSTGKNHKMNEAIRILTKAFDTGASDAVQDMDYAGEIDKRTNIRQEMAAGNMAPQGISTGFKKLDGYLYHKGWGRKELTAFMAGAKQGKSAMLGDICARAYIDGYKCLYVSLELSREIIAARLDANLSDTPIGDLEDNLFAVSNQVKAKVANTKGVFKIVEYPPESFKPSMLRRLLERYRADGIEFDIVAVDYADIMQAENPTGDAIENSKSVWLALRSIAMEENLAMLTASQTNRDGHKASTAKATDVASDFNKIRVADLVISINATDEEKQNGEARLFFAASRNQAGEFALTIKRDLSKGQAITKVSMAT